MLAIHVFEHILYLSQQPTACYLVLLRFSERLLVIHFLYLTFFGLLCLDDANANAVLLMHAVKHFLSRRWL